MATKVERYAVCDVCESADDVKKWRIADVDGGKRRTVDLCGEHGAMLTELVNVPVARARSKRAVTPISEITTRKRKPAKKRA